MAEFSPEEISKRIAQLRKETAGARGKSAFARRLGLSPSTYDYYESGRVPPADVLVRIAEATGVDLWWLLTGEAPTGGGSIGSDHPVLRRAAALLARDPSAAAPLAAFLDILTEAERFPAAASPTGAEAAAGPGGTVETVPAAPEALETAKATWIPILGRSAAGVPHFWADEAEAAAVTMLDQLVSRQAGSAARTVRPAMAAGAEEGEATVQIITLTAPDDHDVVQFVAAEGIKRRCADAFALRIDGDSMAPDIRHGDLVILSPSRPAVEGRAAVVQLEGQIGVTCKLLRSAGDVVHLVPINERYEVGSFPAGQVVWALRVLARVRP